MKLYIVRHGQSEDANQKLRQRPSAPLSAKGQDQAKAIAKRAANLDITQLWSSTYIRTYQTAEFISQKLNLPIITESLAVEQDPPNEVQGLPYDHPEVIRIDELLKQNALKPNYHYSNEETFHQIKNRALLLKTKLMQISDQTILLVSHGNFTRMFIACVMFDSKLTPQIYYPFTQIFTTHNTGLTVFEYTPNRGWKLISWNDQSHLGE